MNPVLLYDGVCGLCNRLVQFVLRRDRRRTFRFAALQSDFARETLSRHGVELGELNTMYIVHGEGADAQLLSKSDAVLFLLRELGGVWGVIALARVLPRFLRNGVYDIVARYRYRVFGRSDACALPPAGAAERFLDETFEPSPASSVSASAPE